MRHIGFCAFRLCFLRLSREGELVLARVLPWPCREEERNCVAVHQELATTYSIMNKHKVVMGHSWSLGRCLSGFMQDRDGRA